MTRTSRVLLTSVVSTSQVHIILSVDPTSNSSLSFLRIIVMSIIVFLVTVFLLITPLFVMITIMIRTLVLIFFFLFTTITAIVCSHISFNIDVLSVNNLESFITLISNRNWDFSDNNLSFNNWNWYRYWVRYSISSNNRSLQVMNSLGVVIVLNIRLSNNLLSRNLNILNSILSSILSSSYNRFLVYISISLSLQINLNIFSLNNWLDIVSTIDLRSRSLNGLSSLSISVLSRSSLSRSVNNSVLLSLKINLFGVIYNFSIVNRLGYNFSCRSIESSVSVNNSSLSLSSLSRVVNNSILSSINLNSFGFGVNGRLYISLSNSQLSWNININSSG